MTTYRVEVEGTFREVYLVDAESPEAAKQSWHDGNVIISEAIDATPVSVEVEP